MASIQVSASVKHPLRVNVAHSTGNENHEVAGGTVEDIMLPPGIVVITVTRDSDMREIADAE